MKPALVAITMITQPSGGFHFTPRSRCFRYLGDREDEPIFALAGAECVTAGRHADVVDRNEIRMIQRGGGLGLLHEPPLTLRIDRYQAVEMCISRLVHHPYHPPRVSREFRSAARARPTSGSGTTAHRDLTANRLNTVTKLVRHVHAACRTTNSEMRFKVRCWQTFRPAARNVMKKPST